MEVGAEGGELGRSGAEWIGADLPVVLCLMLALMSFFGLAELGCHWQEKKAAEMAACQQKVDLAKTICKVVS